MKIELKNIKVYEKLSEETNCYTATIYIDGMKVATAENHGQGGPDSYHFKDKELEKRFNEYCESLPPITTDWPGADNKPMVLKMDAELYIGQLVEDWRKAQWEVKEKKRLLNQKKRWCSKMTVFRLKGDAKDSYRTLKMLFGPTAKAYLVEKYGDKIEEIVNETIL